MNCVVGRREGDAGAFGRSLRIHVKRSHGHDVIEKEEQFSAFLVSMTNNTVASRSGVASSFGGCLLGFALLALVYGYQHYALCVLSFVLRSVGTSTPSSGIARYHTTHS